MYIFYTEVRVLLALHYNNDNKNSTTKKRSKKKKEKEIVVKAAGIRETTAGRYARNIME